MNSQSDYELEQAKALLYRITSKDIQPCRITPTSDRKRPDFIAEDAEGTRYVLELTRLLTPELRNFEGFLKKHVAGPLAGRLPATFVLDLTSPRREWGNLTRREAQKLALEIQSLAMSGIEEAKLSNDYMLTKLSDAGSRLSVWIMEDAAQPDLMLQLQEELREIVCEASQKFSGYVGGKILSLDTSQSGLEINYWETTEESRVREWLASMALPKKNIDEIWLVAGPRVWAGGRGRALAGHNYANGPPLFYRQVYASR